MMHKNGGVREQENEQRNAVSDLPPPRRESLLIVTKLHRFSGEEQTGLIVQRIQSGIFSL